MDSIKLLSGDNNVNDPLLVLTKEKQVEEMQEHVLVLSECTEKKELNAVITPEDIDSDNEIELKEKIAQYRDIIGSLKLEMKEEKIKLERESITYEYSSVPETVRKKNLPNEDPITDIYMDGLPTVSNMYEACVDSKLNCDVNLMEYEKQLQIFQNTLNMAQLQKKKIIKKEMLAKAYRLKIFEVENQCNIELLRIKQNLQSLEPLQMIVNKWQYNTDDSSYYLNNSDLIPRYPEFNNLSQSDIYFLKDSDHNKIKTQNTVQDESTSSKKC